MRIQLYSTLLTILFLAGCAGKLEYIRPVSNTKFEYSKEINKPRELVWNSAIPALAKQFFVINNIDKSSGLVNLSYSGDPEAYIDCGRIVSYVSNARGERTYDFPGAKASQTYEVMNVNAGQLLLINRRMSLEGRINLIFEEVGPERTRVSANTRYVVDRELEYSTPNTPATRTTRHTISFNGPEPTSFPAAKDGRATECRSTGKLESDILTLIK